MRELSFEGEARKNLLKGVEIMYKAVATTLGPKGRNVAIAREWGNPIIVHDGVTVAREVADKDEFVNMGINLIREAASKTNDEAGDGTTTSTLLAYFIIKNAIALIDKGANPMVILKQIKKSMPVVYETLKKLSIAVTKDDEVARIAKISSADEEIGKMVSEAVKKIGLEGTITVEDSTTPETTLEYSEGLQVDKGWTSPYFITNPKTMESVIENAAVVVVGKKITGLNEIQPLLEVLFQKNKNIVMFGDVGGVALNVAVHNKMQGVINMLVVDIPGYSDRRDNLMQDIAIVTGGKVIKEELGLGMNEFVKQFDIKWVGKAKKVIASKRKTVIIGGSGEKKAVDDRVEVLREQIKNEKNQFEVEKIKERLAKLTTGVAVIRVGAKSEVEKREREERVKDAVSAAQAAKEEGIVAGGGVTFLKLADALEKSEVSTENDGLNILVNTFREPIKKILINAGEKPEEFTTILSRIKQKGGNFGYEMEEGKIVDMIVAGIIDPTKVIRLAVENAVSVAGMILTTDVQIVIKKDKDDKNA